MYYTLFSQCNGNGAGFLSSLSLLVPGVIAQPPEVPESEVNPFTATITWDPPSKPNGPIIGYTVNLVIVSSNPVVVARRKRQAHGPAGGVKLDCVIGGMENIDRYVSVTGNPPPTSLTLDRLSECCSQFSKYCYTS